MRRLRSGDGGEGAYGGDREGSTKNYDASIEAPGAGGGAENTTSAKLMRRRDSIPFLSLFGEVIRELCFTLGSKISSLTFPLFTSLIYKNTCIMRRKREKKGVGGICIKSSFFSKEEKIYRM